MMALVALLFTAPVAQAADWFDVLSDGGETIAINPDISTTDNGKSFPNFCDKFFTQGAAKHEGYVDYSDADWCIKLYPNLGFQRGKHELFPFPYSETSVNENIKQNPGWE